MQKGKIAGCRVILRRRELRSDSKAPFHYRPCDILRLTFQRNPCGDDGALAWLAPDGQSSLQSTRAFLHADEPDASVTRIAGTEAASSIDNGERAFRRFLDQRNPNRIRVCILHDIAQ